MTRDTLYAEPRSDLVDFAFDANVAAVFPNMIRRSVPGYELIVAMTGLLAAQHAQPGTCCYDLGASTAAGSVSMARSIGARGMRDVRIVAIDNSAAMLAQANEAVQRLTLPLNIEFVCDDLMRADLSNASVVVMNFTLQFVPLAERLPLLTRIRQHLVPGGGLLLAEKIQSDERYDELLHESFKRANGYSALEVAQKRQALERVMLPESVSVHEQRLREAGFAFVHPWFRCLNWMAFVATP